MPTLEAELVQFGNFVKKKKKKVLRDGEADKGQTNPTGSRQKLKFKIQELQEKAETLDTQGRTTN